MHFLHLCNSTILLLNLEVAYFGIIHRDTGTKVSIFDKILLSDLLFLVGMAMLAAANSVAVLVIGRAIVGFRRWTGWLSGPCLSL